MTYQILTVGLNKVKSTNELLINLRWNKNETSNLTMLTVHTKYLVLTASDDTWGGQ